MEIMSLNLLKVVLLLNLKKIIDFDVDIFNYLDNIELSTTEKNGKNNNNIESNPKMRAKSADPRKNLTSATTRMNKMNEKKQDEKERAIKENLEDINNLPNNTNLSKNVNTKDKLLKGNEKDPNLIKDKKKKSTLDSKGKPLDKNAKENNKSSKPNV